MHPVDFSNVETWKMAEWLTSDENQMILWEEKAKFYAQLETTNEIKLNDTPVEVFAKKMKEHYMAEVDMVVSYSIFNDLIRHSLNNVAFDEVADVLMDRYRP